MLRGLALIAFVQILAYGWQDCPVPPDALAALRAYLSYDSAFGSDGNSTVVRFSFVAADGDALFLQHQVPRHYDRTQRLVYVFRQGSPLFVAGCPAGAQWPNCAVKNFRVFIHEAANIADRSVGASCELSVAIPAWHSSPDSALKRSVASEVLQELYQSGYRNPKAVYVRDFNLADPELDFYIVDAKGNDNLQGCAFDVQRHPHCVWHLYGQSPVEAMKRAIMARSYKLFPPEPRSNQPGRVNFPK